MITPVVVVVVSGSRWVLGCMGECQDSLVLLLATDVGLGVGYVGTWRRGTWGVVTAYGLQC